MKTKFDINLLEFFTNENSIELIGNYENLTRESIINGKCNTENCNGEFSKTFRTLFMNNSFYCNICAMKHKCEKIKETNIKNCGFNSNLQCPITKEKIKQTNLMKYGYKFHLQNNEVKQKRTNTFIKKYGTEHPCQNEIIKQKIKKTNLQNYGFTTNLKSDITKQKIKQTNLIKYGVENPFQSSEIRNKIKKTNLKKYGYEFSIQSDIVKMKIKENNMLKYGVEHPSQNSKIAEKISEKCYKNKTYIFPSGKTRQIQGYENFALDFLLNNENINENNIITSRKNVPEIWYYDKNNKKCRHYVDIFITNLNKCIEVKSTWTAEKKKDYIFLKQAAAKELGYEYEIWIYDRKGNIINKYL
jgi:hypothetical protein